MNIKRFIGLEGLNGSGKTTTLKELSETLAWKKGGTVRYLFSKRGSALNVASFPPSIDDYIVVIEISGKIVVIVTGGDDWWVPEIAVKVIASIQIEVDIFIAAIRKAIRTKRKYPSVRDGYCRRLDSCQMQFMEKNRIGHGNEMSAAYIANADSKMVRKLMKEICKKGELK